MLSYSTVTSNSLFFFNPLEERDVQKSVFQAYSKTNQIPGSGDYAKTFHGKYWGGLKMVLNKDQQMILFLVFVYMGDHLYQASMKLKSKRNNFIRYLKVSR